MKTIVIKAVEAYYGYHIEMYQNALEEIRILIENTVCETQKAFRLGEYRLLCSLAYLNMPGRLCEFYEDAIRDGVRTDIFKISPTFLLAWGYEDLIEYFGMPPDKADKVADQLERAVSLHSRFATGAEGTDLLYRAELALRRQEYEKALYFASEARKCLPCGNRAAHACSFRISEEAYRKISP